MTSCFTKFLRWVTKGSLEKELYWWDIFYRYEAHIGGLFAFLLSAPFYSLLIYYFISNYQFKEGDEIAQIYGYLLLLVFAIYLTTGLGVLMIVGPSHPKDGDVGQGGLLISTCFGYIGSFIVHFLPLLILFIFYKILLNDNILLYIFAIYYAIYYATIFWLKRNIRDYVNWRFDWAIQNYNDLLSGHDVWWTSFVQRSVQRQHMMYFRSYKRNASIVTIMTPMLLSLPLLCGAVLGFDGMPSLLDTITDNKVEEVQGNITNSFDSNIIDNNNTINMLSNSIDSPDLLEDDIDLESEESSSLELRDKEYSADYSDNKIVSDGKEAFDDIKETTTDEGVEVIIFERKLNETDTDNMSKREMYILRNMIYARHGYKFKNVELQNYFSKFSWYKPITDDASSVNDELSEIEKYNVDFIRKHE